MARFEFKIVFETFEEAAEYLERCINA